jgi:GNAT superfamily N-acetyltransferase
VVPGGYRCPVALELIPGAIGPDVERLLPADLPTRPRALGVIDSALAGRAWVDDPDAPRWTVVVETSDGTVFVGGDVPAPTLVDLLRGVETDAGDLIFGFAGSDDPVRRIVPPDPYFRGEAIDFTDRVVPADEAVAVAGLPPAGVRLADLDGEVLPRTEWYADTLSAYGSAERWAELGIGRVLLAGSEVAAEAMAGPRIRGLMEMGVATRGPYRRNGYGTYLSRLVARACEANGDRVWWNTSATNLPSQRIARRLGFRTERRYDLVAYRTDAFGR